jgi:CRP-like cAMP-binding protein
MGDKKLGVRDVFEHTMAYLQRFTNLNREETEKLIPYLEIRKFEKKKKILNQGEIDDHLNVVIKGLVRKYVHGQKGEVTLQLATEGHFVQSEISYHRRQPSEVILETLEPTTLVSMHYSKMQEALIAFPWAEKLGNQIVMQMFIKKDTRYFDQLNTPTRQRFLEYIHNHPHMLQRVPQKVLASYLNIKPETFSRLKHLLRKK